MSKTFFLVGPTAVGKTELAVALAERVGAEIISADAFQVYQGFDILTAKPTPEQQQRIPHHLLSYVPACETYSVARFARDAQAIIERLESRRKPALVVGGNGLYVKALTHGLAPLPAAQPALRMKLEAMTLEDLLRSLREKDPETAATIDARNKRRLVRALEVCLTTGERFSAQRTQWNKKEEPGKVVGVFLNRDREDLVRRISERTKQMFARGVVREICVQGQGTLSPTAERIIGMSELRQNLAGRLDLLECKERIYVATRQYAKRQVTWFKRETGFANVNVPAEPEHRRLLDQLEEIFRSA